MKAILILGAAVWVDGPSPTLRRRTAAAYAVWQADPSHIIVPCGGLGQHPPTEAEAMAGLLKAAGVPADKILCEPQSTNTLENIQNAIGVLGPFDVSDVTIVTDSYHVPRAWLVARFGGLKPRMVAPSLRGTHIPTQIKQHVREAFALPIYALRLGLGRNIRRR